MSTKSKNTYTNTITATNGVLLVLARLAVMLLVCSFLLQPITFVYANEDAAAAPAEAPEPAPEPEPEPEPVSAPEPEPTPESEPTGEQNDTSESDEISGDVESEKATETEEAAEGESDATGGGGVVEDDAASTEDENNATESSEEATGTTEENENGQSGEESESASQSNSDSESQNITTETSTEDPGATSGTDSDVGQASTTETNDNQSTETEEVDSKSTDHSEAPASGGGGSGAEDSGSSNETGTTTEAVDTATTTPTTTPVVAGTSTDVVSEVTPTTTPQENTASSTDEVVEDVVPVEAVDDTAPITPTTTTPTQEDMGTTTEVGTTTAETTDEPAPMTAVIYNDSNKHQFSKDECVLVGDGSYYCSKSTAPAALEDGVTVAIDEDGDREIYIVLEGEKFKVTDNQYDDMAPYYDPVSERIVWHSLRDGRYQIVSYDIADSEETLLTNTPYNNMEPTAFGDVTLWQAWIGGDWEVVMYQGGTSTQLTDNETHDVAPHMQGEYIVWQSQYADGWYVKVYDTTTGEIETIEGDGSLIQNPRFVLVYDSTNEAGDVETLGYDLKTKQVVPLASTPAPVPSEIPEPDTTGEERALIQSKPTVKNDSEDEGGGDVPQGDNPEDEPTASSTPTGTHDIDMKNATGTDPVGDEELSIAESDIVIEAPETDLKVASSTETHIDDLVIPSFATSTVPQDEVASTTTSGDNTE